MKSRLMRYYFLFAVLTLALLSFENGELKNKTSSESVPASEELKRRPVEPNNQLEENDQTETRKSRPSVSYRSNMIC